MSREENVRDDELPRGAGDAAEVEPTPAATVIVCRGEPIEVLMMLRHEKSSFVPDVWVFPGGALDASDTVAAKKLGEIPDAAMRVCALRELLEETGLWLGDQDVDAMSLRRRLLDGDSELPHQSLTGAVERLVLTSRWVTPVGIPRRFDTFFFIAESPGHSDVSADLVEASEIRWIAPPEALRLHEEGTFPMVLPTIKNLQAVSAFSKTSELMAARRGAVIPITRPVLVVDGKKKRIVLPDEA